MLRKFQVLRRFQSIKTTIQATLHEPRLNDPKIINKSLPSFILDSIESRKDILSLPAIIDGSNPKYQMTFQQVYESSYKIASALSKLGIGSRGTVSVSIISPNSLYFCPTFLGLGLLDAISTTLNPSYTIEEMSYQISTTDSKLIIAHPLCLDKAISLGKTMNIPVISMGDSGTHSVTIEDLINSENMSFIDTNKFHTKSKNYNNNSIITLPFSSGTTGKPKGVMLSHRNLVANLLQSMPYEGNYLLPSNKDDIGTRGTLLVPLPFFHIYGMICGMFMPLLTGGKLIFMPAFDLIKFLELIQTYKVTRALVVPPIVLALSKHPIVNNYDLSSLQSLMSGAAPLGGDLQEICAKRLKCAVKQGWGMTELSPIGVCTPDFKITDEEIAKVKGKAGLLVPGTSARIVDPVSGKDLPITEEGELLIKGPQVMLGYYNNKEATESTLTSDGWLKTGDIAKFDADGWLIITDRCKELIKYKGFQVAPAELEATLASHKDVKDCIVIPVPDEEAGEIPRAYVVKQDGSAITSEELIEFVKSKVSSHKRLRGGVIFTDAIPKSPSGKLLRRVQITIDREKHKK